MMKKKVLFVMYNVFNVGGIQSVVMSIVKNLNKNFEFDMICFQSEKGSLEDDFISYGGKIIKKKAYYTGNIKILKRLDYYIRPLKLYNSVKQCIQDNGPYDIIHCHNAYESGICLKVAADMGVPICIAHSHTNFNYHENIVRKIYNFIYRMLIKKNATYMIGCSTKAAYSLFGNTKKKVLIINNGVDTTRFNIKLTSKKQRNNIRLLQVATFSKNKNQCFSINVLRELLKQNIKAELVFIGRYSDNISKQYYNEMKFLIEKYNLESYVKFLPSDSDIPKVLAESDCLLFPSLEEGFPLVPLEAQALGLRCYISDTITKDINCGGCVFLSLIQGEKEWAEKIIIDLNNNQLEKKKYIMDKFDNKTIMNIYRSLYKGEFK